jgi:hypothetical protein
MKKIVLIIIMILLLLVTRVKGEKIGALTEVLKPGSIEVSKDRLYVVEGATFYVYSLKDLGLITTFGKSGEGPGELKVVPMFSNRIKALHDKLFAEGMSKVIFFSKDATLLREIRKKGGFTTFKVMPIKENFAAVRMLNPTEKDKKYYLALSLLDPEMNVKKILYKQEFPEREKDIIMVTDSIHFEVYKDKLYVEESERGFLIEVFDSKGDKLFEIKKNFTRQTLTEKDKAAILKNFKEDNFVRMMVKGAGGWENFKTTVNFIYPDTFPPIQDITVTDDKLYVSTYNNNKKGDKVKYIVMDLKGNIISTPYMPVPRDSSFLAKTFGRDNRFYGITNGKFYYLMENEDDEVWEVHAVEIK